MDAIDRALAVIGKVFPGAVPVPVVACAPRPECPLTGVLASCLSEADGYLCRWCTEAEIGESLAYLRIRAGAGMTHGKFYAQRADALLPRWKRGRERDTPTRRIPPNPWASRRP